MTSDLIERVRSRGADLLPCGQVLRVLHPERLDAAMIEELRREKSRLLPALEAEHGAVAIVSAQRLLRECRRLPTPPACDFPIRHHGEACQRCVASWREHFPAQVDSKHPNVNQNNGGQNETDQRS